MTNLVGAGVLVAAGLFFLCAGMIPEFRARLAAAHWGWSSADPATRKRMVRVVEVAGWLLGLAMMAAGFWVGRS